MPRPDVAVAEGAAPLVAWGEETVVDEAGGVEGAGAGCAVEGGWGIGGEDGWGDGLEADEAVWVFGFLEAGACSGGSSCGNCAGRRAEGGFVRSLLSGAFEFLVSPCLTGGA